MTVDAPSAGFDDNIPVCHLQRAEGIVTLVIVVVCNPITVRDVFMDVRWEIRSQSFVEAPPAAVESMIL